MTEGDWIDVRPVGHAEAREIAQRLINSHFGNPNGARMSIPTRPNYDDDCLILAYIWQQERRPLSAEPLPPDDHELKGVI